MDFEVRDVNQKVLKFEYENTFKIDDFYISKSNEHISKFLDKWPKWEKNFLNISGEKYSGKTHLIKIFLKKNYDYLSNLNIDYIPDGFHCEIFKFSSLEKAYKLANSKFHREHVTSFLWSNPKLFLVHHFKGKKLKNHSNKIRLTLDYKPDYILIKKIFEKLYKKNKYFSLNEITNYLKKNQSLLKINQKYHKLQWNKFHKKRNKYLK